MVKLRTHSELPALHMTSYLLNNPALWISSDRFNDLPNIQRQYQESWTTSLLIDGLFRNIICYTENMSKHFFLVNNHSSNTHQRTI